MTILPATTRILLLSLGVNLTFQWALASPPGTFTLRIAVDQFGYAPDMAKVAVISDPQVGFNAADSYTPGGTLEVRTWGSNTMVFSGAPVAWNGGSTNAQSGDRAWRFDFSPVTTWGEYYIYDPANDTRSARFLIDHRVYEEVLKHAMRVFYYQRRGAAKSLPHADARWTDGTNFLGSLQDTQCRLVTSPGPTNQKDLRGGWFDAGDYNKYVNFTSNGIPDVLDELKWELDWLLRMQTTNGSVLSKMGVNAFQGASPPSAETNHAFYGAQSTTATLTTAGNLAQAVRAYQTAGMTDYANTLSNAAVAAYNWAVANPSVVFTNTGFSSANPEVGDYAYDRDSLRLRAAIFLYEMTGQSAYRTYVESNYANIHALQWTWWGQYEMPVQDALLHFTTLPGVTPSVITAIRNSKQSSINGGDFIGAWTGNTDPYRSYLPDAAYHWGNNQVKSKTGLLFAHQLTFALNPSQATNYRAASAGYLHYAHGVNALTMAFLSNMYDYGADNCANEMYHSWFGNGTIYDNALTSPNGPAPGYVTGGVNKNFAPDPAYGGPPLVPPMSQPVQKSYKDWNTSWPENSWELTEPAIYYQGAYVYLLSRFVRPLSYQDWTTGNGLTGSDTNLTADPDGDSVANIVEYAFNLSPQAHDLAGLPQFALQSHNVNGTNGTYLTVQFLRQLGSTNLGYVLEGSDDLTTWTPVCTIAGTNNPGGPGFISETGTAYQRTIVARDTVPVEQAAGSRFARFRLVWN
jgi:hypothetical protein